MNDVELRAFLSLMMCSDPWPLSTEEGRVLEDFADAESKKRGFDSWFVAFHEVGKKAAAPIIPHTGDCP